MGNLRIRIKMCGMTRIDDISYAVSLGVDAIGLVFYQKSNHCVSKDGLTVGSAVISNMQCAMDNGNR